MANKSIFVCSSTNGLDIALGLKRNLKEYEVEPWKQGAFQIGQFYLESLAEASQKAQFAILVLTPHQDSIDDGAASLALSPNVLFEIGYFVGIYGRSRTFFLLETSKRVQLPAYLDGISYAEVERNESPDLLDAALIPALAKIRRAITHPSINGNSAVIEKMVSDALCVACQALASPFTAEEARLRAFVFKKEDNKLTCTHYWAPYDVSETVGVSFDINAETQKQVAVVMAATRKSSCKVAISVRPEDIDGLHGNIDPDLQFIHAVPIFGPKGEVWGTIDFDASHWKGENILRDETANNVLLQLGKHLYRILAST